MLRNTPHLAIGTALNESLMDALKRCGDALGLPPLEWISIHYPSGVVLEGYRKLGQDPLSCVLWARALHMQERDGEWLEFGTRAWSISYDLCTIEVHDRLIDDAVDKLFR